MLTALPNRFLFRGDWSGRFSRAAEKPDSPSAGKTGWLKVSFLFQARLPEIVFFVIRFQGGSGYCAGMGDLNTEYDFVAVVDFLPETDRQKYQLAQKLLRYLAKMELNKIALPAKRAWVFWPLC